MSSTSAQVGPRRAGERREAVLLALQDAPDGLGVKELAAALGLHPNTVRFHLDRLVNDGLVARAALPPAGPGRPRIGYLSVLPRHERNYELLARMLTSVIATGVPDPAATAQAAGTSWGRQAVGPPPTPRGSTADTPHEDTQALLTLLQEVGFQPQQVSDDAGSPHEIWMQHCPFYEAAQEHGEVVCSLHLGLMQGALRGSGSALAVGRLDPFVQPRRCVAHLQVATSPTS